MPTRRAPPQPRSQRQTSGAVDAPEECILVLQGGGALGAYQAGVYEALGSAAHAPDWVAGISIGGINSALIAGNPPERRLERLREFWDLVSSTNAFAQLPDTPSVRDVFNEGSALQAVLFGVPGFFTPRMPPAPFQVPGTLAAISYYDTAPLKQTLERLVDFDLINSKKVRLSLGAVNVRTGNFAYFDSAHQRIDARHVMASGALPPGFPPIEIDGEHYWDGGLVSNTPLQYVLDQPGERPRVVFQVDLFAARGDLPTNLPEVTEREKDIRFSSRTRMNTSNELARHRLALAVRRLIGKLPPALRDDPDARLLLAAAKSEAEAEVSVVHLIYRSKHYESQSKDYEFSRLSMQEHWDAGRNDMQTTLTDPRWLHRRHNGHGVHVYDLLPGAPDDKPLPPADMKKSASPESARR